MKRMKITGIVALALATIVLLTGVFSLLLRGDNGMFGSLMDSATEAKRAVDTAAANVRSAESAARKADTAVTNAEKALQEAEEAISDMQAQTEALAAHMPDDETIHALYIQSEAAKRAAGETVTALDALDEWLRTLVGEGGSLQDAVTDVKTAAQAAGTAADTVAYSAQALLLEDLRKSMQSAYSSVDKAETSEADARKAVNAVLAATGAAEALPENQPFPFAVEPPEDILQSISLDAVTLREKADWLQRLAGETRAAAQQALSAAQTAQQGISMDTADHIIDLLARYYIAIWFTGILLLAIGIILTFFGAQFLRQWKKTPVFSTFIALVVMLIIQTYSMKFTYDSFGEWAKFWFDNAFNVLRANTSVGIIALGMTLVIITGGIDLAVGSTLAGVGTVVMVLIDTSPRGILVALGITGVPAFLLGILGGFLAGALIGALVGLGVTKGRVPPFIMTLGIMNIVRSVAQYFTKSYTPKVPPDFTAISNTVVFGQRLLPIIYWLVLAVILYILMNRTRFGRHVYAVGSNERTSRLSGINVDRVKFMVYTLMGFLVSVAAVTQVSRLGGMDVASAGGGYELDAIAAVVVGGTSMSGGRGSILGTVIGVLIIGVMNNLLILLGVDSFLTNAFKGAIVIGAVLMQRKEKEA